MNTTWGILAHVDAGKTTLSEAVLYNAGVLASTGRVDKGDAFLDTDQQEKNRGITIFSKPAVFDVEGGSITLLDTPGHVDFATETERAIWALDFAILLVSGTDGVQAHTKTLFDLLSKNKVPTIIFINKVDMPSVEADSLLPNLKEKLSGNCVLLSNHEDIAAEDEGAMEEFFETGELSDYRIYDMIISRKIFPVLTGSALKDSGVKELLDFMKKLSEYSGEKKEKGTEFGARIYKIESLARDTRLTFAKITSGSLKVKNTLPNGEKVDQIRLYSGAKYTQIDEAKAGDVVALIGPKATFAGEGMGVEDNRPELTLNPVLKYTLNFTDDTVPRLAYPKLSAFNDEDPSLNVSWNDKLEEITFNLMGEVQTEIILTRIENELGIKGEFVESGVLYKETVADKVEGVGHFEPLRHYAEAHILMEPLEPGSGIQVDADVSTDDLALNWQRLITTHILEKDHLGVSIGAPLTDVKFTVVGGRAHIKHTEGGDFREATYRAIRQGLMEVGTTILEPYFNFEISVPSEQIGRVMTDVENMKGSFEVPEDNGGLSIIRGNAPASQIRNYQSVLVTFTKGQGHINLTFAGYSECKNPDEVMEAYGYDPEADIDNPASSVFCSHGAAEVVPWYEVKDRCHVPCRQEKNNSAQDDEIPINSKRMNHSEDEWLDPDEIDKILQLATHSNQGKNPKKGWHYGESTRPRRVDSDYVYKAPKEIKARDKYLLVDGYNLIYAWPELKEVLDVNLDGARGKLLDILSNYKAMTDYNVIAVFDAYRVKGHEVTASDYLNIHQVFTAEAQTADAYIERFTHEHGKKYDITVVTSDGLEQVIIRGAGARLISSREFIEEVERKARELRENYDIK
ncbi:small GTP-binding protein domain-containing protein [Pseudobutyrivibrio sp. C4]|uniref:translation factor GTPase family protein n=1 Tax=Pseudobutyrivibrio sp. C4 TaxID=1520803 RepID=UPI0008BB8715|nr:TetM/TetW/TetO/TetS family tetracycline resistance ribosomal protection protein [Pseudobutyrivibrio sp. C4]SES63356.1 small GTP-binding protein domain-containing protein [Pseudobutyrivibrio sp. C4]